MRILLLASLATLLGCPQAEEAPRPQPDTPADLTADAAADAPPDLPSPHDATPDVTPDMTADVSPEDITPDLPPDVTPDLPPPSPEGVPMFVAVGYMGRTTISCDDGLTWVANRSFDADGHAFACGQVADSRCYSDTAGCSYIGRDDTCVTEATDCDCNHHPGAATGVTFAGDEEGGAFIATFGWGPPGAVFRSEDGITWEETVRAGTPNGLAYGQGRVILGSRDPKISEDAGVTWTDGTPVNLTSSQGERVHNVRGAGHLEVQGGRFWIRGATQEKRDIQFSADAGETWWTPDTLPPECLETLRGVTGAQDKIFIGYEQGVCISDDGAKTFTSHPLAQDLSSPRWDGARYLAWARGSAYTSPDALTWTEHPLPGNLQLGSVTRNPGTGTFIAVRGGWKNWYDKQRFYRSSDGLTWTELPPESYDAGHGVRHITFGWAKPGTVCPER